MIFDCVVVGLGGHGSAVVAHLAQRNAKVLGLEKFDRVHDQGSSYGRSRIVRMAYYEDAKYIPLLRRSFELWRSLAQFVVENPSEMNKYDEPLLTMTGGLYIGLPSSEIVRGSQLSCKEHNLPYELLNAEQIHERFPVFHPEPDDVAVYEAESGYVIPEMCIDGHCMQAEQHGAELHYREPMVSWRAITHHNDQDNNISVFACENVIDGEIIEVTTDKGVYLTRKLVLSVGVWAPETYGPDIPMHLHVERRVLHWIMPRDDNVEAFKNIPIFIYDFRCAECNVYGFPHQAGPPGGVKVAKHVMHSPDERRECTPSTVRREVDEEELQVMLRALSAMLPDLGAGTVINTATCMYTMTPDEHFLVDFLPSNKNVVLVSPCSGHGFKFCPVIGEIVADLVLTGVTPHDISLFTFAGRENK